MYDKIKEMLKEKDIIIPSFLFYNFRKLDITSDELLLIIYLLNKSNQFNITNITEDLNFKPAEVILLVNSLEQKGIIKMDYKMVEGIKKEFINLDNLFAELTKLIASSEEEISKKSEFDEVLDKFKDYLKKELSQADKVIIDALLKNYNKEMLLYALNEAVYNGADTIDYIDNLLSTWNKKGFTSTLDIDKDKENSLNIDMQNSLLDDYDEDWLNE